MPHPIEDYLNECLSLLQVFWDKAIAEYRRWESTAGPHWETALRQACQYGQDSDFLLRVLGAR